MHGIYQTISSGGTKDALSIIYNRNPYALVMMTGIMTTCLSLLYLAQNSTNNKQLLFLTPFLLVFLLALVYCRSRSGWISTGIFFVGFLCTSKETFLKYKYPLLVGGVLILSIFLFDDRIAARFANLLHDKPREEIWSYMLSLIQNNLYFGHGLVEFNILVEKKVYYFGTHNSILEVLLYTGILGIIAYSIPLIVTIKSIFQQKRYNLIPVLLAFFTLSQFNLSVFGNKTFLSILTLFLFFVFSPRGCGNHFHNKKECTLE
ncbi:MAG: O-antigen ligase family protein [Desulfopila sp.]